MFSGLEISLEQLFFSRISWVSSIVQYFFDDFPYPAFLPVYKARFVVVYQCFISNVTVTGDIEALLDSKVHAVLEC